MSYKRLMNLKRAIKYGLLRRIATMAPNVRHCQTQRGFTTTEILVAITIIGIMLAAMSGMVKTDRSKATSMMSSMSSMSSAMQRAKADMGCYPKVPGALWDSTLPTGTNMYCGLPGLVTWAGPYLEKQPVDSTGAQLQTPKYGDSSYITINREATPAGGLGWYYYLRANNIQNAVISEALQVCNGKTDSSVTFSTAKCRATLGTGGVEIGTFDVLVEESR